PAPRTLWRTRSLYGCTICNSLIQIALPPRDPAGNDCRLGSLTCSPPSPLWPCWHPALPASPPSSCGLSPVPSRAPARSASRPPPRRQSLRPRARELPLLSDERGAAGAVDAAREERHALVRRRQRALSVRQGERQVSALRGQPRRRGQDDPGDHRRPPRPSLG